jgi:small-conductance mechanosensitive channel
MSAIAVQLGTRLVAIAVDLLLIAALTIVALQVTRIVRNRALRWLAQPEVEPTRRARLTTLLQAGENAVRITILAIAALMALTTLGINIAPALASLGLIGLALSLGAQSLIKDYIGGLVILIDNLVRVGDIVKIEDVAGTVERITLRATYVRDGQGRLVSIPNGEVRIVANSSFEWARAVVDLSLPFDADLSKVLQALERAMQQVASAPEIANNLLESPQIRGWNAHSDWAIQVRIMARTAAGRQFDVERLIRKYALGALTEAGVALASPAKLVSLTGQE